MIEVSRSIRVRRPAGEVEAQFGDIAYHQSRGHHRGVAFRVVEETADHCAYEQETRVGPVRLRQRFRLQRGDPSHQVNELLEGAFAPGSITFDIASADGDDTLVTATLRSERGGLARIGAPLLRRVLGRALAQGLEEDRADLETGRYAER